MPLSQSIMALQHTATHCNTLQHICNTLQHTATHCNTLQHICNTLQHTGTCAILTVAEKLDFKWVVVEHGSACRLRCCLCCSVLQCIAECCSVLPYTYIYIRASKCTVLQKNSAPQTLLQKWVSFKDQEIRKIPPFIGDPQLPAHMFERTRENVKKCCEGPNMKRLWCATLYTYICTYVCFLEFVGEYSYVNLVYIHMYICMWCATLDTYIYTYVLAIHIHTNIKINSLLTDIQIQIHICYIHTFKHKYIYLLRTYIHVQIHIHKYIYTNVCGYMYRHIHI